MNHYEALGVPVGSEVADIRKAYLAAARRHHPDFHVSDDPAARADHARRMQAVTEAWAVLGDPVERERYDLSLVGRTPAPATRGAAGSPEPPPGKGWTPRPGDDGWQRDFHAWAAESDVLPPDAPTRARRGTVAVLPLGLFLASLVVGFVGLVLDARSLLTVALMALITSSVLFMVLPLVQMARGRRDLD